MHSKRSQRPWNKTQLTLHTPIRITGSGLIHIQQGAVWAASAVLTASNTIAYTFHCPDWKGSLRLFPHTLQQNHNYDITTEIVIEGEYTIEERDTEPLQELQIYPSWAMVLDDLRIDHNAVISVFGPRGSGKSTFSQLMSNSLLNRYDSIAYLDTDLGQSEFTPSGLVSITIVKDPVLGVNKIRDPAIAVHVGSNTPSEMPVYYAQAITQVLEAFKEQLSDPMPMFVNVHGWIKGLGYELCLEIFKIVQCTHIVNFTKRLLPVECIQIPVEPYQGSASSRLTSYDYRKIRLHRYMQNLFSYHIRWDKVTVYFIGEIVSSDKVLYALNGVVVGLCISEAQPFPGMFNVSLIDDDSRVYMQCIGLGTIRHIDVESESIIISTPIDIDRMHHVNALTRGNQESGDAGAIYDCGKLCLSNHKRMKSRKNLAR